jgi:signal recognition particle subunit SRP54
VILGNTNEPLELKVQPPAIILMAGLQGSGKTTTSAKLARWLMQTQKKKVLLVSTDIYRPAAIEQLQTLAGQVGAEFFPSDPSQDPVDIANQAIQAAKNKVMDVVIIDTAGRLHIDDTMMAEIKRLHAATQPAETLFVVDSMTGQDAANTAKAFNDAVPLTGIILTKADGDTRGGAALSMRQITGKPIKFMGMGEKIDALEPFYPDRIASRILGMGDVLSLVEQVESQVNAVEAKKLIKKVNKGKFDFEDFRAQLRQIHQMGGMMGIMSKLPGMNQLPGHLKDQMNDKKLAQIEAIINSMTPLERRFPERINSSRKQRILKGSGTTIQVVNQLLKQFNMMQKMMWRVNKQGGMMKLMRGMQGKMPFGNLPPGFPQ